MRILYISNEAALGGAAQSMLNMIKALRSRNVSAVVILPGNGIIEKQLRELKVSYYIVPFTIGCGPIGTGSVEKMNADFNSNYSAALRLQEIIRKEKIDLVHINSSTSNVGAFAALIAGIPYVWHLREFPEEDFEYEFWDKELKKKLMSCADAIIAISNVISRSYKEKYQIDSICIYNGLDIDRYKNELRELPNDAQVKQFIVTGAISKNKGQYDAVKAVELLVNEGISDIQLTLVGHGGCFFRWFLKQYVTKKKLDQYVTILPFQEKLTEYRKRCEYALTTSKMEALGRCTIEAMLAGNIVIGADTGGTKEIIGEDETRGYLYRQGDAVSLATVMKRVISESSEKKKTCRQNAQRYAEETFSPDAYADKIISLYSDVLEQNRSKHKSCRSEFVEELAERYKSLKESLNDKTIDENNYKVILEKWSKLEEQGHTVSAYLKKNGCESIAIYGMGNLGCRLYDELSAAGFEIPYVIDKNPEFLQEILVVKSAEDNPTGVDIVIVTVSKEEKEIVRYYKEKYGCYVIGLSELLSGILYGKRDRK